MYKNILEAVGNTPVVELSKLRNEQSARILAKLECLNVGGSVKTRTALGMLDEAEREGKIDKNSIIVEPTSGNQGISLALIAAIRNYRAIIVMPECMSEERKKIVRAYGAEIVLTPVGTNIKETFENCIAKALEIKEQNTNVFIPNQFKNPANPHVHELTTAKEILEQVPYTIDAFIAGIGTGGSITGIGSVLKEKYPHIKIIAVEPDKAAALSGKCISCHMQQGIGDGFIPEVLDTNIIDRIISVSDIQAVTSARRLAAEEGILAGVSSGSNTWVAIEVARELESENTVLTLLPDTGERYLSTPLFEDI